MTENGRRIFRPRVGAGAFSGTVPTPLSTSLDARDPTRPTAGGGSPASVRVAQGAHPIRVDTGLVAQHHRGVWRYLRFLGADAAVAEDLTQDAFVALLRAKPTDQGDAATARWLRTTARNLFVSRYRAQQRAVVRDVDPSELDAVFEAHAGVDGSGDEYAAALRHCVAALDARERELVALRFDDRVARSAVGERVGLSDEGVKSLWRRIKARLRTCIERRTSDG